MHTPRDATPRQPPMVLNADAIDTAWKFLLDVPSPSKFHSIKIAARKRQNEVDHRSANMFAVEQKITEAIRSRKTYQEIRSLITASKIVVHMPNEAQQKGQEAASENEAAAKQMHVSYRQQGNLDMYSSENMKRREANRHHPEVLDAITKFWNVLPKTNVGNINKGIYIWYSRQLFFSIVDGTEAEFQQVVQEDWRNDAVWSCSMNERMFAHAIFNLADIWCETLDPKEYRDFITRCAEIVASGPPYTGSRREGDVTDSGERATTRRVSTQVNARRVSAFDAIDDEPEPVEETIEHMEHELAVSEYGAWYGAIRQLAEIASGETNDCEEDMVRQFVQVQDRRHEIFNDDDDPSYALQQAFFRELETDKKRGEARGQDVQERLAILNRPAPAKGDLSSRRKRREKELAQHQKEQKEILGEVRSTALNGFVRLREYRNSLLDLNRAAIKEALFRVGHTQPDLTAFLALQLSDMNRRCEADAERNDDYFTTFNDVTKDLEDFRKIIARRHADPIEASVYVVTGHKDSVDITFDSPQWVVACEWFEKYRQLRTEAVEQAVFEVDELITRQQFRGKQQLFAVHRQQIDFETKLVDALAETNLLQNDIKIARLGEAKAAREAGTERRAKETALFQSYVDQWKELLSQMQSHHSSRQSAESKETKAWLKAGSVDEAFTASKAVLECMSQSVAALELEETTATGPRVATDLPGGATTPMQLLRFVVAQHDAWHLSFLESIAKIRVQVLEQSHQFLFHIEADEEVRQFENNMSLLNMRLDDIHRIKGELSEEQARAMLTVSCQVRLNHSADVKDAVGEMQELFDATKATIERFTLLLEQRHRHRHAAYAKLFMQLRLNIQGYAQLEQLRGQTIGMQYMNQTAAARKAALQAAQLSDFRRKEDERMRIVRENLEAEAREAEARRIQAREDAEAEQQRLRERHEMKLKDQADIRKRQLKEREAALQEKIRREKAEQKALREAYLREQAEIKKQTAQRVPAQLPIAAAKKTGTAPIPAPSVVRRKPASKGKPALPQATPLSESTTAPDEAAAALSPKSSRRGTRIQQCIEAEIAMFRVLNSESLALDMNLFNTRRMEYLVDGASNRQIYESECQRLKQEKRASVEVLLSDVGLDFQLSALPLSHFLDLPVRTLFDIIALNPVQKILLRGVNLDKDELKKLAQHLLTHPFVHVLDVSENKELGAHGAETLLALVKENTRISTLSADGCGMAEESLQAIYAQCKKNQFMRGFSRTDFDFIFSIFKAIDADNNGTIDGPELAKYLTASAADGGRSDSPPSPTRAHKSADDRKESVRAALMALNTAKFAKNGGLTLSDLLVHLYSQLTPSDAAELIRRYTEDGESTKIDLHELQEFVDTYGTDGAVTLQQLAAGLEEDTELLRAAFSEADLDNDGVLNLSELVTFLNQ